MGNANPVVVNKLYTGNLYRNFDKDYYRIRLNGTNNVIFKFMIDDSVDVPGRWRVDFYDAKTFKRLKANKNNSISANETWTVRCTGDLIVKLELPAMQKVRSIISRRLLKLIRHLL